MQDSIINSSNIDILIVDDEVDQLRLLSQVLTEHGYKVRHAINGSVALMGAFASPPDLILLDLRMPDLDGYQVCERLRNSPLTWDIPIIFLSATDEVFDKVRAFELGANDYICKPFYFQEILVRIKNQIELNWAKKQIKESNLELEKRVKMRTEELEITNQKLVQEIEQRKKIEQQLCHQSLYDKLTGLANRVLLINNIENLIQLSRRKYYKVFALLFIDLDRFKMINDSLGLVVGDQLLIEIARRLQKSQRSGDTVARLGADEFVILLGNIKNIDDSVKITKRIHREISKPVTIHNHNINITASIGIAINNNHLDENSTYDQADHLIRDADIAMYRAKSKGQGLYEIFDVSMHSNAMKRLKVESDLRRAIALKEFIVYYQTIVSLSTQEIIGFEALIRWNHPDYGLISPNEFIDIAEETGLIVPIDLWMLEKACYQLSVWQKQVMSDTHLTMSINLSGKHFSQSNLIKNIDRILVETGLDGSSLKLEITERILIENAASALQILEQLRERNIQLCLDDFGTGYSSLSYLHKFPFDTLKIDRSFIKQMAEEQKNHEIVKAIINLGLNLGMSVVAEGIETEEQFLQLQTLDCNYGQGYWFSRPVEAWSCEEL
jgi:diguanylate cyclase (GGDEF)-like protein